MTKRFQLDKKVIKLGIESSDRNDVLKQMAKMLKEAGYVKETYITGILEREKVFSTGLPTGEYGVAIPHTDVEHVNKPMIAISTLKTPVEFNVMGSTDGEIVNAKIIFMLAMKDSVAQLNLLQNIMSIIQNNELLSQMYNIKNEEDFIKLIEDKLNA